MSREQVSSVVKRIEVEAPHLNVEVKQDQQHGMWYIELSGFRKTPNPVRVRNLGDWELFKEFMRMQIMY